jgi:hypothetical protein
MTLLQLQPARSNVGTLNGMTLNTVSPVNIKLGRLNLSNQSMVKAGLDSARLVTSANIQRSLDVAALRGTKVAQTKPVIETRSAEIQTNLNLVAGKASDRIIYEISGRGIANTLNGWRKGDVSAVKNMAGDTIHESNRVFLPGTTQGFVGIYNSDSRGVTTSRTGAAIQSWIHGVHAVADKVGLGGALEYILPKNGKMGLNVNVVPMHVAQRQQVDWTLGANNPKEVYGPGGAGLGWAWSNALKAMNFSEVQLEIAHREGSSKDKSDIMRSVRLETGIAKFYHVRTPHVGFNVDSGLSLNRTILGQTPFVNYGSAVFVYQELADGGYGKQRILPNGKIADLGVNPELKVIVDNEYTGRIKQAGQTSTLINQNIMTQPLGSRTVTSAAELKADNFGLKSVQKTSASVTQRLGDAFKKDVSAITSNPLSNILQPNFKVLTELATLTGMNQVDFTADKKGIRDVKSVMVVARVSETLGDSTLNTKLSASDRQALRAKGYMAVSDYAARIQKLGQQNVGSEGEVLLSATVERVTQVNQDRIEQVKLTNGTTIAAIKLNSVGLTGTYQQEGVKDMLVARTFMRDADKTLTNRERMVKLADAGNASVALAKSTYQSIAAAEQVYAQVVRQYDSLRQTNPTQAQSLKVKIERFVKTWDDYYFRGIEQSGTTVSGLPNLTFKTVKEAPAIGSEVDRLYRMYFSA